MTTVTVTCPVHGQYEVFPSQVRLMICTSASSLSYYTFTCTRCGTIRKPADGFVIAALSRAGLTGEPWTVPAEAFEPHSGPPICVDDIIDLHFELDALAHLDVA